MTDKPRIENPDQPTATTKHSPEERVIQKPVSLETGTEKPVETEYEDQWDQVKDRFAFRSLDSEDAIRLRSDPMKISVIDGQTVTAVDAGLMQKISIILGVQSCPYFSDTVGRDGVTEEVYMRRFKKEWRRLPVDFIDHAFLGVREKNKRIYQVAQLKKR